MESSDSDQSDPLNYLAFKTTLFEPLAHFRYGPVEVHGRQGAIAALSAVVNMLGNDPEIRHQHLLDPLSALLMALIDVHQGIPAPMPTPQPEPHRPKASLEQQKLKAHAAMRMDYYMRAGLRRKSAAEEVAKQLHAAGYRQAGRDGIITERTVRGWRDELIGHSAEWLALVFQRITSAASEDVVTRRAADELMERTIALLGIRSG